MFGISDLITVSVIRDGLKFLSNNPTHIEYILGQFCIKSITDLVGIEHIKQCVDFIKNNRIEVYPFYQADMKKRPSVVVVASGAESMQFIGDFGAINLPIVTLPEIKYSEFNIKSIDGCTVKVSSNYNLESKLWKGMYISALGFQAKLEGILTRDNEDTILYLDKEVPENVSLVGWSATSSDRRKGAILNASTDDVVIQCKLTTTGDFSVHRLLAIVIRYCLKIGRLKFDEMGLQVATFSYSPPMLTDQDELEYESIFSITGKFTDHWIEREFDAPDDAANIDIGLIVERSL